MLSTGLGDRLGRSQAQIARIKRIAMNPDLRRRTQEVVERLNQLRDSL